MSSDVILGINYAFHDTSACLLVNGTLVAAVEEERFSRNKHTWVFPERAIGSCLKIAGLTLSDVKHIAVSLDRSLHWGPKLLHALKNPRRAKSFLMREVWQTFYNRESSLSEFVSKNWPQDKPVLHRVPHHLAHSAGSFFASPYETAAVLSLDGSGEWATASIGAGQGASYKTFNETFFPDSLGSFYETATQFCGFKPNYDEGKTMGLAPMGDPEPFYSIVDKMIEVNEDGSFRVDSPGFNFQYHEHERFNETFTNLFGPARKPNKDEPFEEHHLNVAAAFQKVLEEKVLRICAALHRRTKEKYLVISGGVSLNSVMNGRIIRESEFEDVYVMPAAGDNGTSIGAAYYVHCAVLGQGRSEPHLNPYLGTSYTDDQILEVLSEAKAKFKKSNNVAGDVADLLASQKILGWFQGRMEIGPRALGGRSIIADPTSPLMKDKINAEVKHREAYRPFAPSALVERRNEYFDIGVEDPFMLKVCNVLPEKQSLLPAITHVDGTARLQTVNKETNPMYYDMIEALGQRNGVPVVLNTSFNVMGEPIVESPLDAIRCFYSTGLDALAIGSFIIEK